MLLEEWKEWRLNPSTLEFFKFLDNLQDKIKDEWANSIYTGPEGDETLQRNAAALGQVSLLREIREMTFEDLEEIKSE